MSYFVKKGNTFRLTAKECLDLREKLPVGTYSVGFDACAGQYYLEIIDPLEIKHKLYGNTIRDAGRILRTFKDRSSSTGVLLTGVKGSGKTLLAKSITIEAAKEEIPTLVVNQPFFGDGFNNFMQAIHQPTVVLFDEFEKVYNNGHHQEKLLTLLDGVYPSQKLFLLTCNDKWRVNDNMRNRPGRIFYLLEFEGLDAKFIQEYCEDNLKNKELIPQVVAVGGIFSSFNFDLLKGIVEDMNRYGETPAQVLRFLNARPSYGYENQSYKVKLQDPAGKLHSGPKDHIYNDWSGNPLKSEIAINYGRDPKTNRQFGQRFTASDLKEINNETSSYLFENQKGAKVILTRKKTEFEVNFDKLPSLRSSSMIDFPKVFAAAEDKPEEKKNEDEVELEMDDDCYADY